MFMAGTSFTLHYKFLLGDFKAYFRDKEFLFYSSIIGIATVILIFATSSTNYISSFFDRVTLILFQVISITTTTGFGIGIDNINPFHFGLWSTFCQFLMILLMLTGGSAGSTSGGIKTLRVYLSFKFAYNEIIKFIYPRHIKLIRIGKEVIPDSIILSTLGFMMIHIFVVGIATLIMNFFQDDLIVSFSSVIATLNNIGPGLGGIGPDQNFAALSVPAKWVLTFCMLLGRLELYSVIILLVPATWKKT